MRSSLRRKCAQTSLTSILPLALMLMLMVVSAQLDPTPTPATPVPPLVGEGVSISAQEGSEFIGSVATFTATVPGPFTAAITWGDAGDVTPGNVQDDGSGRYQVTGAHTFRWAGAWAVSVSISDGTQTATATSTATIADVAPSAQGVDFSAAANSAFSGTVATFRDANPFAVPEDFAETRIDWGDGTPPSAASITPTTGEPPAAFTVNGSHTYADAGTFTVSVSIVDYAGGTATTHGTARVAPGPVVATPVDRIVATEGRPVQATVATFTAIDEGPFSASISWADGSSSAGSISADGQGGYLVTGQHAYAEAGHYAPVEVSLTHATDYTSMVSTHADVAGAPIHLRARSISATAGTAFDAAVGTFSDDNAMAGLGDIAALIDWGDGSQSWGSIDAGVVQGSHIYPVSGPDVASYPLTVVVYDWGDTWASDVATATVAPPAVVGTN